MAGSISEVVAALEATDKIHTETVQPAALAAQTTGAEIGTIRDNPLAQRVEEALAALFESLRDREKTVIREAKTVVSGTVEADSQYREILHGSQNPWPHAAPEQQLEAVEAHSSSLGWAIDAGYDRIVVTLQDTLRDIEVQGSTLSSAAGDLREDSVLAIQQSQAVAQRMMSGGGS